MEIPVYHGIPLSFPVNSVMSISMQYPRRMSVVPSTKIPKDLLGTGIFVRVSPSPWVTSPIPPREPIREEGLEQEVHVTP